MAITLGDLLYRYELARTPEEAQRLQLAIDELYEALGLERTGEGAIPNRSPKPVRCF